MLNFDGWIDFPGVKEIDLYGKATASAITIVDDRQPSNGAGPGFSTGCANMTGKSRVEGADDAEVSHKDVRSSSSHTDTRLPKVPCVWTEPC